MRLDKPAPSPVVPARYASAVRATIEGQPVERGIGDRIQDHEGPRLTALATHVKVEDEWVELQGEIVTITLTAAGRIAFIATRPA